MSDILAVLLGIAIGTIASVPVAMVIAASTTQWPARARRDNRPALDVPAVDVPQTAVIVWEAQS